MVKRLSNPTPEPHITVERRHWIAHCSGCGASDRQTTLIAFGPSWMALSVRLCAACREELRVALDGRART